MATYRNTLTKAYFRGKLSFGPWYAERNDFLTRQTLVPDKVSGGFITFENGSKFRKATGRVILDRWIEPATCQNVTATHSGVKGCYYTTNPGGVGADAVFSAISGNLKSSVGSLLALNAGPTIPSSMRSEAATKALLKISDQKAGIAEDLVTFRQTVGLVQNPASTLLRSLKSLKDDRSLRHLWNSTPRSLREGRVLDIAARKYLEYAYGWKPLMSDIHGIMSLLKSQGKSPMLLKGEGSSSQQCQCGEQKIHDIGSNVDTVFTLNENAKVKCNIWGRIDPNCPGLRSLNQLGLLNPIALAWDLMPFSFVVDWFIPIGSCLQALTAPAGLIFVDGSMSVRNSLTGPYTSDCMYLSDQPDYSNSSATGTIRYEGYYREHLDSWPLPGVWANPNPLVGDRSVKALALAILNLKHII